MQQLGKYQLVRRLATGGMAEVFLAKAAGPMGFEKTVVVKRILPHLADDPQFIDMFLAEARLAADLNHPNIVQIFDFGQSDGAYFIAMEYIDGPSLRALADRADQMHAPLPYPVCAKLLAQACEGLAYAHEACDANTGEPLGLIHRDISPDNLLLARNGSVKVVDFGIAKAAGRGQRTTTGVVKGKLAYMPPEQLQAEPLDRRVDVFALGMVLYEISTGRKPFDAETDVGAMQAILFQSFFPPSYRRKDYPEALGAIAERALAKDRELRYPSCRELQAELEAYLQSTGENVTAFRISQLVGQYVPVTAVQRTPPPGKSTPSKPWPTSKNPAAATVNGRGADLDAALDAAMADANAQEPDAFARTMVRPESGVTKVGGRRGIALLLAGVAIAVAAAAVGTGAYTYLTRERESPPPPDATVAATAQPTPTPTPPEPAAAPPSPSEPAAPEPAPSPDVAAQTPAATPEPAVEEPRESGKRTHKRKGQEVRTASASTAETTSPTAASPATEKPATASFAIDSEPAGLVKVDGKFVGPAPVKVREHAVGEVRVEVSDPKTGFRQEQTFTLAAGDNGTKKIVGRKGKVEFRIFPYARVIVDGKVLGQTPIPPADLYEGTHSIRLVNEELKKDVSVDYAVTTGSTQIFKYNLSN